MNIGLFLPEDGWKQKRTQEALEQILANDRISRARRLLEQLDDSDKEIPKGDTNN